MIGTLRPQEKQVLIIGAGISGLLAGYFLKKQGYQVQIREASSRTGGLIDSKHCEHGISESAAHSLLITPDIQSFFDEIGVELIPVHPKSRARFIYRNGKPRRMPLRFFEILYTLFRFFCKPNPSLIGERATLADWCRSYLGKPALQFLLSPFITGVYATAPEELNAKITFPKLFSLNPSNSLFQILRARPKSPRAQMMTPKKGMLDVVQKLSLLLKDEITLNSPLHEIPNFSGNLIFCIPTAELSKLISREDPSSAEALLKVKYSPLVTCTAFFKESSFCNHPPRGVGVLIPRGEGLRILGCLYNSSSFEGRAKEELVSLTIMIGGSTDPEALELTDDEISKLIQTELKSLVGLTEGPVHLEITRWRRAIPIYSNSLREAQNSLKTGLCSTPGRLVLSNFSKEVSIRGLINALQQL